MSSFELKLDSVFTGRNPKTGRFVKGCTPYTKGKKWNDFMSKRGQRKALANLRKGREVYVRPPGSGRPKKKVIAVNDHGKFVCLGSLKEAGRWLHGRWENISRCCKENRKRTPLKNGHGQLTDKVNTDHKYKGLRFYFEDDPIWLEKIKK